MFEPFAKTPGEELEILVYVFPCYAANTGQISALVNLGFRKKQTPLHPLISPILGPSLNPNQFLEDRSHPHLLEYDLDFLIRIESYVFYSVEEIVEVLLA